MTAEIDKNTKINKEKRKLKRIFKDIAKDKKTLVERLIENAAFMSVTLEDMQEDIKENGSVMEAVNGNGFKVLQTNPAQTNYNTLIKCYSGVIKQLTDLLPDGKEDKINKAGEALAAFVAQGKPGTKK